MPQKTGAVTAEQPAVAAAKRPKKKRAPVVYGVNF